MQLRVGLKFLNLALIIILLPHCRFMSYRSEQQWRDLAHCLTQINFNDRCVRKLQDNFACYQDKLVDRDVYTSFTSVTNKAKKFAKPETKVKLQLPYLLVVFFVCCLVVGLHF